MDHHFFILNNLENFLLYELQPARIAETLTLKPATEWVSLFEQECRNAIQNLKDCRYRLSAADFLRHMQLTYADTLDVISCIRSYERSLAVTPDLDLLSFYPLLVISIQTVLTYIEGQANFCTDPVQRIPGPQLEQELSDLQQQNLLLRARYRSRDIDPALQEILNGHLDQFFARSACSYRDLLYTKKLMQGLAQSLAQGKSADYSMQLISRLICLNFNQPEFYEYVQATISCRVDEEERPERKASALRFYSKEIQTLLCKPHIALHPDAEAIQTSLLRFLAAELDFYAHGLAVGQALAPHPGLAEPADRPKKIRIQSNVHEIGTWIQLLMQTQMVASDPVSLKELLRSVVDNFSSIGSDQISLESLTKRVYERDSRSAARLKKTLERMIEILDRDYLN